MFSYWTPNPRSGQPLMNGRSSDWLSRWRLPDLPLRFDQWQKVVVNELLMSFTAAGLSRTFTWFPFNLTQRTAAPEPILGAKILFISDFPYSLPHFFKGRRKGFSLKIPQQFGWDASYHHAWRHILCHNGTLSSTDSPAFIWSTNSCIVIVPIL